jgi:hypothetical protein
MQHNHIISEFKEKSSKKVSYPRPIFHTFWLCITEEAIKKRKSATWKFSKSCQWSGNGIGNSNAGSKIVKFHLNVMKINTTCQSCFIHQ